MRKKNCLGLCAVAIFLCIGKSATAQSTDSITLSLDQAITIALSENPTIIVSDMEIKRTDYARRESIGGLLPTIDYSGSYSRTLKKQVMYMDIPGMDMAWKSASITLGLPAFPCLSLS